MEGRDRIMAMFFQDWLGKHTSAGKFTTSFQCSGAVLHADLCKFLVSEPEDSKVRFISFFPLGVRDQTNKTKSLFKLFLDDTLGLRRSNKHGKYWVKTEEEAIQLNRLITDISLPPGSR
jgi:hypothetical protein